MPTPLFLFDFYKKQDSRDVFKRVQFHYKISSRLIQQKWIVVVPAGDSTKMQPSIQNGETSVMSKTKINRKPL
jgi:hypothetical protein